MATHPIITEVTYSELVSLIDNSLLEEGLQYLITDFATTYWLVDCNSNYILDDGDKIIKTGINEPLLVTAISNNKLAPEAHSALYPKDIIHYNYKNSDRTEPQFFDGDSYVSGLKGVITYRKNTTYNIASPNDWRNIIYRLWSISQAEWSVEQEYHENDFVQVGAYIYKAKGTNTGVEPIVTEGWEVYWTDLHIEVGFKSFIPDYYMGSEFIGMPILDIDSYEDTPMINGDVDVNYGDSRNIVIEGAFGFTFMCLRDCYDMTFGSGCGEMTFGAGCGAMTFGSACQTMTFGSGCFSMTFGTGCGTMTFGSACGAMTFGSSCGAMTFGTECDTMTFGAGCFSMTFGSACDMTFGSGCGVMTFGSDCETMTFGAGCGTMTFGSGCGAMTFDSGCNTMTFGSSCAAMTFGSSCAAMTFDSGCGAMTFGSACETMTFGSGCRTMTFGSGCYEMTFGSVCRTMTFGSACQTMTFGSACFSMTFGSGCGAMTFDSGCNTMTFGSGCGEMTFGSGCGEMTFGSGCGAMTFGSGCYSMTFDSWCNTMTFPENTKYNNFLDGVNNKDFTIGTDYIDTGITVTHQIADNGGIKIVQSYLNYNTDHWEMVYSEDKLGVPSIL